MMRACAQLQNVKISQSIRFDKSIIDNLVASNLLNGL